MGLGPQDTTALLDHVHIWVNFCMIELMLASADGTADCVYRQWFLEVFLGPFSNVNDRIMPMSDAVSSEGPKTTGIQQRSSALSLMHRDFSSFSESFDDVMHCRWWDLQSLCNLTLRNVVFKVFHNLFMLFIFLYFHRLESLCPSLLLRDSASLRHPFYS